MMWYDSSTNDKTAGRTPGLHDKTTNDQGAYTRTP